LRTRRQRRTSPTDTSSKRGIVASTSRSRSKPRSFAVLSRLVRPLRTGRHRRRTRPAHPPEPLLPPSARGGPALGSSTRVSLRAGLTRSGVDASRPAL
jgi:hypothetical protein